jgi:hypothetical protein
MKSTSQLVIALLLSSVSATTMRQLTSWDVARNDTPPTGAPKNGACPQKNWAAYFEERYNTHKLNFDLCLINESGNWQGDAICKYDWECKGKRMCDKQAKEWGYCSGNSGCAEDQISSTNPNAWGVTYIPKEAEVKEEAKAGSAPEDKKESEDVKKAEAAKVAEEAKADAALEKAAAAAKAAEEAKIKADDLKFKAEAKAKALEEAKLKAEEDKKAALQAKAEAE